MKPKWSLPIPFLILILAGLVSIYSILASRSSGAAMAQDDSLQMQTVEQERMAAMYFRVLSWLSDVTPRNVEPGSPAPASVPRVAKTPRVSESPMSVALCAYRYAYDFAHGRSRARRLN